MLSEEPSKSIPVCYLRKIINFEHLTHCESLEHTFSLAMFSPKSASSFHFPKNKQSRSQEVRSHLMRNESDIRPVCCFIYSQLPLRCCLPIEIPVPVLREPHYLSLPHRHMALSPPYAHILSGFEF